MKRLLFLGVTLIMILTVNVNAAQTQPAECALDNLVSTLNQMADQLEDIQTNLTQGGDTELVGTDLSEIETQLRTLAETCSTIPLSSSATPIPVIQSPSSEGDVSIYALTVIDSPPPSRFYAPTAGTHLVSVEIAIENLSSDTISVNPLYATLVDNQGILHSAELGATDAYAQIDTLDLYPQELIRGWISFEVEDGSAPSKLKYEVGGFAGPQLEVSLEQIPTEPQWQSVTPVLAAPTIGDIHTTSGYSLVAEMLVDPAPPSAFFTLSGGTRLVAVQILVRNESASEPLSVNPLYANLVDNLGFVYSAELGATELRQIDTGDLALGEGARGYVSFQIPNERSPLYIRYSTTLWGSDQPLVAGLAQ